MINKILNSWAMWFVVAVFLLVLGWQVNNLFHVSGETDGFERMYALIPCLIWCAMKARTMKEQ